MKYRTLEDTVELMNSKDYRERFVAEYLQTVIRYRGLRKMLHHWSCGELDFTPTCPKSVFDKQCIGMRVYIEILQERAKLEGIELKHLL